jgi:hypothetical protein
LRRCAADIFTIDTSIGPTAIAELQVLQLSGIQGTEVMMKLLRLLIVFAIFLLVTSSRLYAQSGNYAPSFLQISAWTSIGAKTRYPASGTFDLSNYGYIGGIIGLNPSGDLSHGVVTFFWTSDTAGQQIVGVQGMNLSSLIVSTNQLRLPNQGPYLYITYQPFLGPNPLAANLFPTNVGNVLQEIPGDTILIDEANRPLGAYTSTAIYPADYFAGEARLYLSAPAGVTVTLYGADLTDQFWPLDSTTNGSITTVCPMGTWLVVVSNASSSQVQYTVAVTPLLTGRR